MSTLLLSLFAACFLIFGGRCLASTNLPPINIEKIDEDVYLHTSHSNVDGYGLVSANGLVITRGSIAYIVDTPWSLADTKHLLNWIEMRGLKPAASLSTHSHEDRTAGIEWLNSQKIPTYAHELTNSILEQNGKTTASISVTEQHELLGNSELEIFYPGPGHTVDNIVLWDPTSKTLFGGCLVRSQESKTLGYTGEAFTDEWSNSIEKILERYPSVKHVIPGHGGPGGAGLLTHTQRLALSHLMATKSLNDDTSK